MLGKAINVVVACSAKINLTLDILGCRADGYHEIESVVQSIGLWDKLTIMLQRGSGIKVTATVDDLPIGAGNTVHRACEAFLDACSANYEIQVHIDKGIPRQAGLGGGSSDAAGILIALNSVLGEPINNKHLSRIAASVGSDVPFFLIGGTALVHGRGEHINPLPAAPEMHLVIAKPSVGVSTAWAYRRIDEIAKPSSRSSVKAVQAILASDRSALIASLSNDFQDVIEENYLEIVGVRRRLLDLGAEAAMLCGSGSSVFGVFPCSVSAKQAADAICSECEFAAAVSTVEQAIVLEKCDAQG
jgi:4-diphosphocytidyl-2-C-methyl-D-erythritol kinase